MSLLLEDKENFAVRALLNIIIDDAVSFFNVGKTMSGPQLLQTVELIVQDYKHFKPEDFKLCFNNAKKGHYGITYDRIDGQIIFQWLVKYDNSRDEAVEAFRANENRELKKAEARTVLGDQPVNGLTPKQIKLNEENLAKLKADRELRRAARDKQVAENTSKPDQLRMIHQQWLRQFSELYTKKPLGGGIRIIKRYGRMMDISAYLEHKQWQYNKYLKSGK